MAVFTKIYGREFASTQMAETLQRSFETIMAGELPTIRDVSKLLTDDHYRDDLIETADSEALDDFWHEFEAMTERAQHDLYRPVLRRLRDLYGNKLLYPILCNPAMLNVRELMEQNKIILFNLRPPEGQAPPTEAISLLGSIILSSFQLAVLTRKLDNPFYLYVDEAHRFVTSALDDIFVMARSQNLRMVLITQYPKQLPTDTLQAVLENVGATFTFKCGDETARVMKGRMAPQFEASDLIEMDLYKAAARILYKGQQMPAFLLETPPPPTLPENAEAREADLRTRSDEREGRAALEKILKWLREKYPRKRNRKADTKTSDEAYSSWGGEDDSPEATGEGYREPSEIGEGEDAEEGDMI